MGATHNSLRSDKRHSFSISHRTSPARLPCGPSNGSLRIALDERNCFAVFSDQFNYSPKLVMPPCCASSAMRSEQFCLSAYALLVMCCCDRKKRDACLSAASCASLPIATTQHQEPRRGDALRSPSFAYFFLARQEK